MTFPTLVCLKITRYLVFGIWLCKSSESSAWFRLRLYLELCYEAWSLSFKILSFLPFSPPSQTASFRNRPLWRRKYEPDFQANPVFERLATGSLFQSQKKPANPPGWLQRLRNITISVVQNLKILELSSWSKPNSLSLSSGFQSHARAELWICLKTWPSLLFKSSRNDFLKALIMSKLLSRRQFKRFDPFLGGILKRQLSFC